MWIAKLEPAKLWRYYTTFNAPIWNFILFIMGCGIATTNNERMIWNKGVSGAQKWREQVLTGKHEYTRLRNMIRSNFRLLSWSDAGSFFPGQTIDVIPFFCVSTSSDAASIMYISIFTFAILCVKSHDETVG